MNNCTFCENKPIARGLCRKHYSQEYRKDKRTLCKKEIEPIPHSIRRCRDTRYELIFTDAEHEYYKNLDWMVRFNPILFT